LGILALVTVTVAGMMASFGSVESPDLLGTLVSLFPALVLVVLVVLAGAPCWYRSGVKRRPWDGDGDGAVAASVALVVAVGWLLFLWQDRGLLRIELDGEPWLPLVLAPYVLLGVVWRGRALLPALFAFYLCGMLDELVNGTMCPPADEPCFGPVGNANLIAFIATPLILLGTAISHAVGFGGRKVANARRRVSFGG
jgi:hypothetical protein